VEITLSATDIDGDSLAYTVLTSPQHGTISGSAPNLIYTPDSGFSGLDSFTYHASDSVLESNIAQVDITINSAGPVTVFFDDFESDQGWVFNPFGSDTATAGLWERTDPTSVNLSGSKQLEAFSGSNDLVTGPAGLRSWWWWTWSVDDINDGITTVRSPEITLPNAGNLTLSLQYYFAHGDDASSEDYLRIKVVGTSTQTLFEELGAGNNDDAAWENLTVNLNDFAGQTVYLLIEAADEGSNSMVEAAIDDVLIIAE
jgi:hypothetical protein